MDIEALEKNLPPFFARNMVGKVLPGIISPKSLANLASKGEGPRFIKRDGRAIYQTADVLSWLKATSRLVSTNHQKWEFSGSNVEGSNHG